MADFYQNNNASLKTDYRADSAFITGAEPQYYTVAIGLWNMLTRENINQYYTRFAAGAVIVSIPIAILFMKMQKCYMQSNAGAVKG